MVRIRNHIVFVAWSSHLAQKLVWSLFEEDWKQAQCTISLLFSGDRQDLPPPKLCIDWIES
jgi:hypothetical protein